MTLICTPVEKTKPHLSIAQEVSREFYGDARRVGKHRADLGCIHYRKGKAKEAAPREKPADIYVMQTNAARL